MPSRETVEDFAAEVVAGRYVEAIEGWYADDASMRENGGVPRVGREVLAEGERQTLARFASIACEQVGPALIEGDHVAIRWRFVFTRRDGRTMTLNEIAWQTWRGEKIVEETFFYDPAQMAG